jgi:hypothetical protein
VEPHRHREWAESFGTAPERYHRTRPRYPAAFIRDLVDAPPDLAQAFAGVYRRLLPELPMLFTVRSAVDGYGGFLSTAEDAIRQTAGFGEPEQRRYPWEQTYTRDDWVDQLPASGFFGQIPPDRAQAVVQGIGDAVDAAGGSFTMRYTTVVVTAERAPTP